MIYRCTVGSRAYGLDTETSDTDLHGVYQAPPEMQWSLFGAPDQFEDNEAQTCHWELQICRRQDGNAIILRYALLSPVRPSLPYR